MMLKQKSSPWARLKYLYVLPLAALTVVAFARPEISHELEKISSVKISEIIPVHDLIPGRLAHHAVHSQGKLLLELFHAVLGGFIKRSGNGRFAEGRVVLGNAGELFLQHVDRGAGVAAAQGAAGVALRNGRNVVGGDQLHPAAIVIPQNFQGAFALLGAVHSAPLLHAGAGHAFAIAILGIIGFGVPPCGAHRC